MRISLQQTINHPPERFIAAATSWLEGEDTDATLIHRRAEDGSEAVGIEQLVDGILITTTFSAAPTEAGCRARFTIRLRGTSVGSRIRNLGMLLSSRIVRREAIRQFNDLLHTLNT